MKNIILLIIIITSTITIYAQKPEFEENFFQKTMRFDYYHTGNDLSESISFDELKEEPFWGGSKTNLIDTFKYGRYYFEIISYDTKEVIYSRGFSTLFVEWQDTEEAEILSRTFAESVVFPYPKDHFTIKIYSRNKKNEWSELYSLDIDTEKFYIRKENEFVFPTFSVIDNGDPAEKVDIVFLAEGYTEAEIEDFKEDCEKFAEYVLGASPFKENQKMINIRAVASVSQESGTDIPGLSTWKNTILGSHFYTFGSERYLMTDDYQRVRDIASNVPYDHIFIIVNTDKYGGGGIFNFYAIGAADNYSADFLFIHEFGHSFAGLADEYYTSDVAVEGFYDLKTEPWEPNITTLVNFESKWKNLVDKNTLIPTPANSKNSKIVGVFEGGGYVSKGVYRPYLDCSMKSVIYDAYCPVCKQAVTKMIRFYSE